MLEIPVIVVLDGQFAKVTEKPFETFLENNPKPLKILFHAAVKQDDISIIKKKIENVLLPCSQKPKTRDEKAALSAGWFILKKDGPKNFLKLIKQDKLLSSLQKQKIPETSIRIRYERNDDPDVLNSRIRKLFGKLFSEKRRELGISSEALGTMLGLDGNTIRNWECGKSFIRDLSLFVDIYDKTGIDLIELLNEAVKPQIELLGPINSVTQRD